MIAEQIQQERETGHNNLASALDSLSSATQLNARPRQAQMSQPIPSGQRGQMAPMTPMAPPPQQSQMMSASPAQPSGTPLPVKPALSAPAAKTTGAAASSSTDPPPANQPFPAQQGAIDPWMAKWNANKK